VSDSTIPAPKKTTTRRKSPISVQCNCKDDIVELRKELSEVKSDVTLLQMNQDMINDIVTKLAAVKSWFPSIRDKMMKMYKD